MCSRPPPPPIEAQRSRSRQPARGPKSGRVRRGASRRGSDRPRVSVDNWWTEPRRNPTKPVHNGRIVEALNLADLQGKARKPLNVGLLAMQKVEGSSPFSRLEVPANRRFSDFLARRRGTDGYADSPGFEGRSPASTKACKTGTFRGRACVSVGPAGTVRSPGGQLVDRTPPRRRACRTRYTGSDRVGPDRGVRGGDPGDREDPLLARPPPRHVSS